MSPYATREDFRKLFTEDADSIHLLYFLLTEEFERFVYVLFVLEGFLDHHSAALLCKSINEVQETRLRAVQRLSAFDGRDFVCDGHLHKERLSLAEHKPAKCGGLIDNDWDV